MMNQSTFRLTYERLTKLVPARRIVPAGLRDRITSLIYDRQIKAMPDRAYLQDQLIPLLAARGARNVLFVGVRSYTRAYARLFARHGMTLWTCDIDPVVFRHGARGRHRTLDICNIRPNDFPVQFNAIVISGVIGWGVNDPQKINALAERLRALVQHNDTLILGWNTDRSIDPMQLPRWQEGFAPLDHPDLPNRKAFSRATHVFDLLRASKPVQTVIAFVAMCVTKLCHERVQAVSETLIYV